jgi:hypothetical protein
MHASTSAPVAKSETVGRHELVRACKARPGRCALCSTAHVCTSTATRCSRACSSVCPGPCSLRVQLSIQSHVLELDVVMVPLSFVMVVMAAKLAGDGIKSCWRTGGWALGFMQGTIVDTSLLANAISYIASASGDCSLAYKRRALRIHLF